MHTRDTRSASSEGIRSVARREVYGPGDGSDVWENGLPATVVTSSKRREMRNTGAWCRSGGGQATEAFKMLCPRKGERECK